MDNIILLKFTDIEKRESHSHNPALLSSFMTYHRIVNKSNMTGTTSGKAGSAFSSEATEFTPRVLVGFVLLNP